jgi:phage baseplate assembly protein W
VSAIPLHPQVPVQLTAGLELATVEQGSPDEIAQCVEAIVRTPLGFRDDLPALGVPDQTFRRGGADPAIVAAALERYEPRADDLVTAAPDLLDAALSIVEVKLYG